MNENDCSGYEMEKLQLIDFLKEDDFLIEDADHGHGGDGQQDFRFRLSSVGSEDIDERRRIKLITTQEAENAAPVVDQREEKSFLAEPRRPSFLRKSLSWNRAFFTNSGVLDPEELVVLNDGAREAKPYPLPSTLDSDSFSIGSIQSCEDDLFEDVRASIERSSTISKIFNSGCKSGGKDVCKKKTQTPKKQDSASKIKMRTRIGVTNSFPLKPPRIEGGISAQKKLSSGDKVRSGNRTPASRSGKVLAETKRSTNCSPVPFGVGTDHTRSHLKFFSNSRQKKSDSGRSRLGVSCSSPRTPLNYFLGSGNGMTDVSSSSSYSYESPASPIEGWLTEPSPTSIFSEAGLDAGAQKATSLRSVSAESTDKFRPSGLRMPSPKIGFFDEVNSKMPPVYRSSGGWSMSSKTHGDTDGERHAETKPAKVVLKKGEDTPKGKQTGTRSANSRCSENKKESHKDRKVFSGSPIQRKYPGKATIDQVGITSPFCRGNFPKARKVCDGAQNTRKLGLHSSLIAENARIEGSSKNQMSSQKKGKLEKLYSRARRIFPSKSETKKDRKPTENKRESLVSFEDQFDALMKHFEVIDLSNDTLVDVEGKTTGDLNHYFSEKEDTGSPFSGHYIFYEQQVVSTNMQTKSGSLPVAAAAESMHRARTPLANINSVCSGVI